MSRTTFVNTARRSIVNEIGNRVDISVRFSSQAKTVEVAMTGPSSTCENTITEREALALMDCLWQSMTGVEPRRHRPDEISDGPNFNKIRAAAIAQDTDGVARP